MAEERLKDIELYVNEWTRMMLVIWKERIERLRVVRSGHLHESFTSAIANAKAGTSITMKFVRYGIYQELGVGKGYISKEKGNNGDLPFLDPEYREEHGLNRPRKVGKGIGGYMTSGRPRERKVWFSKKLYASERALFEDIVRILGEEAVSVVCDALKDIRSTIK